VIASAHRQPATAWLLLLLVERKGELVTRDQIVDRLWGKDVFVDTDNGINTAIRKIRQVLRGIGSLRQWHPWTSRMPLQRRPPRTRSSPIEAARKVGMALVFSIFDDLSAL